MKKRDSLGTRLRYGFDKSMAAGPIALIGWLAVASLLIIIAAAAFLAVIRIAPEGGEPLDFFEAFWESLMRTLDAGTMGGDTGWAFRLVMLFVTLAGIFVVSALIGVLSAGVESKLDELRKGRSRVLESDHTIILNWSPSIFDIISELVIANTSRRRPRIVIMANMDKVEMEDEIAAKVDKLGNTRIICRSGDPTDLYDLAIVNPQTSRSIIVLSPDGDDPDSQVIKTVLALVNDPNRRTDALPHRRRDPRRQERRGRPRRRRGRGAAGAGRRADLAHRRPFEPAVGSQRRLFGAARFRRLRDLHHRAAGPHRQDLRRGGDGLRALTLIGLCDQNGRVNLNPPSELVIGKDMRAIIIAEDDAAIKLGSAGAKIDAAAILAPSPVEAKPERTLILGWNRRGPIITYELSRYVAPGSILTIAADTPGLEQEVAGLPVVGDNLSVSCRITDTSSRTALASLDIPSYDHVLVLGYCETMAAQPTDTRTLVTLLHLRKIADDAGTHISIVSEMIDVRNRELAAVTRADDFVVSNRLVSLMLAQASENQYLAAIFDDLLDEEGSEIYMRPVGDYVAIDQPVTF